MFITLFYFEIFLTCNFDSMSHFCFLFSFRPIESPWKAKTGLIWGIKGTFIINSVKSEDFCCKSSCNLTTFYMEFLLWYCQFNSQHSQKTWTYLLIHCVKYVHVYCKSYVIWDKLWVELCFSFNVDYLFVYYMYKWLLKKNLVPWTSML